MVSGEAFVVSGDAKNQRLLRFPSYANRFMGLSPHVVFAESRTSSLVSQRLTDLSRNTMLAARSRRTPAVLTLPMVLGAFRHRGRTGQIRQRLSRGTRTKNGE